MTDSYIKKLTNAEIYLLGMLAKDSKGFFTPFEFFHIIWQMYEEQEGKKLYLRAKTPSQEDYSRIKYKLLKTNNIKYDADYGARLIRLLSVQDLSADEIICIADPLCYISHLSAMQRFGLTNRSPKELIITRPDKKSAKEILAKINMQKIAQGEENPFASKIISHPKEVRNRPIHIYETKTYGEFVKSRTDNIRIAKIGQIFLDMLQAPSLCGGMAHVIEGFEEHSETYFEEIIEAIDKSPINIVKSRAGYILQEKLGLNHPIFDKWEALGQRGGSRKLDPDKPFASSFSEKWKISLNA